VSPAHKGLLRQVAHKVAIPIEAQLAGLRECQRGLLNQKPGPPSTRSQVDEYVGSLTVSADAGVGVENGTVYPLNSDMGEVDFHG